MRLFIGCLACLALIPIASTWGQCEVQWLPTGIEAGTASLTPRAATLFDPDGAGPGPEFLAIAGPVRFGLRALPDQIGLWDGEHWLPFAPGLPTNQITALTVFRGELIAAGEFETIGQTVFNRIARWDGQAWQPLGTGLTWTSGTTLIRSLHVHDDQLIVGGVFDLAGGVVVSNVASWDGSAWHDMDNGMNAIVYGLDTINGDLIAVGGFRRAGTVQNNSVVRWDGQTWSAVRGANAPPTRSVFAVREHNGEIHVAGNFTNTGAHGIVFQSVARFDGAEWQALTGLDRKVTDLVSSQGELIASGPFRVIGGHFGANNARWDGQSWNDEGMVIRPLAPEFAIEYAGEVVYGGDFTKADRHIVTGLAKWNGKAMLPLGMGFNRWPSEFIDTPFGFSAFGEFTSLDGVVSPHLAVWDGNGWTPSTIPVEGSLEAVTTYKGNLVAAGSFPELGPVTGRRVAMWDGKSWIPFGVQQANETITDIAVFRGELIIAGLFTTVGSVAAGGIARWNGRSWEAFDTEPNDSSLHLFVFDDQLIVGGLFTQVPGKLARHVARWDGSEWFGMASGFNDLVSSFHEHQGQLFAGGEFTRSGGADTAKIAVWNGTAWAPLGQGLGNGPTQAVRQMATYGDMLVAVGSFRTGSGAPADGIAIWNGVSWSPLPGGAAGPSGDLHSVGVRDNTLFFGGDFGWIGAEPSAYFARFGCPRCYPDCDQSTGVGVLDIFDFLCFQNSFVNSEPYACDCDPDPSCSVFDFLCFQTAFVAGCP